MKAADGSIWARVPDLEGCYSCGETIDEAKEHVKDAITLFGRLKGRGQTNSPPESFKSRACSNIA